MAAHACAMWNVYDDFVVAFRFSEGHVRFSLSTTDALAKNDCLPIGKANTEWMGIGAMRLRGA
jgi:hypothetical protein